MKNDLNMLCEKIESCPKKLCQKNKIICAKNMLNEYVGSDKNKLLDIKTQIKIHNANNKTIMDYVIDFVTIITLPVTIIYAASSGGNLSVANGYALMVILLVLFLTILSAMGKKKMEEKDKIIKYMEVALEEIEKEWK